MITVHHLNDSRSHRILWLLEELGLPYAVEYYRRDPQTRLAPPELLAVHPLGKAPVIVDDGRVMAESGAIIDYILRRHGGGRLQPAPDMPAYDDYVHWLHFAEGSAMLPRIQNLEAGRLGAAAAPVQPRIDSQVASHLAYVDGALRGRPYLLGDSLTAADIQLSFIGEVAGAQGKRGAYPNLDGWNRRMQDRPAYQAAVAKGGPYALAR